MKNSDKLKKKNFFITVPVYYKWQCRKTYPTQFCYRGLKIDLTLTIEKA